MQLIIDILSDVAIFLLIAYGFSICYSVMGFFQLSHAASLTLAAFMVYTGYVIGVLPLWLSIVLAVAFIVTLMMAVNHGVFLPGEKISLDGWKLMIVSLGIYVVLQNVVSILWGDSIFSFRTWEVKPGHHFLGGVISNVQLITIACAFLLLTCCWLFLNKTDIGLRLKAVSSNPSLSTISGIRWETAAAYSVALGTFLIASAGILIAADIDMTPTMGFDWLMYGVVAMIIGGMGKMRHLVFGALLLAAAQHLSAYFFDSKWMNATAYIILVVFLYFRPYGFSGKRLKKTEI